MLNVEQSARTDYPVTHNNLLEKHGYLDRRLRVCKEVFGDPSALEAAARNSRIVADYLTGKFTMREIGMREGISHERVRQVLSEQAPEYKEVRRARRQALKAKVLQGKDARREAIFIKKWGCDRESFARVMAEFPDARLRFKENKGNAHTMKRPWSMTFFEWATCWIESGKVQLRGHKGMRGSGRSRQFWMSPIDPAVGYTVGNVRIVQVVEILEERDRRRAGINNNIKYKQDINCINCIMEVDLSGVARYKQASIGR